MEIDPRIPVVGDRVELYNLAVDTRYNGLIGTVEQITYSGVYVRLHNQEVVLVPIWNVRLTTWK